MRSGLLVCLVLLPAGCSLPRRLASAPIPDPGPIILVADGAGDFRAASTNLRRVLEREHSPVRVHTVVWSHGFLRILRDQLDYAHARSEGRRLGETIAQLKYAQPERRIYLVGHSAGSVVALAAAECAPPGSIEAMALLAPSVSSFYDLRPSLPAIRDHIDVYYSCRDWGYLGLATAIFGTSDRLHVAASGRIGFQMYEDDGAELKRKVRQHAWRYLDFLTTGNEGGHYGSYKPRFLRRQVLPALLGPALIGQESLTHDMGP